MKCSHTLERLAQRLCPMNAKLSLPDRIYDVLSTKVESYTSCNCFAVEATRICFLPIHHAVRLLNPLKAPRHHHRATAHPCNDDDTLATTFHNVMGSVVAHNNRDGGSYRAATSTRHATHQLLPTVAYALTPTL